MWFLQKIRQSIRLVIVAVLFFAALGTVGGLESGRIELGVGAGLIFMYVAGIAVMFWLNGGEG